MREALLSGASRTHTRSAHLINGHTDGGVLECTPPSTLKYSGERRPQTACGDGG